MKKQDIQTIGRCIEKGHEMEFDHIIKDGNFCSIGFGYGPIHSHASVQMKCSVCGYTYIQSATRKQEKAIKILGLKAKGK